MEVTVLFFGEATERVGKSTIKVAEVDTLSDLKIVLFRDYPKLKGLVFKMALNKLIVNEDSKLNDRDEVALLPPFSGG